MKSKKIIILLLLLSFVLIGCGTKKEDNNKENGKKENVAEEKQKNDYRMKGNGLEKFDLFFMKLENKEENKVYSPLSIKYALEMLAEGANGETKEQIENIIGDYVARKYTNSKNMSFANGLFVKDSFKDNVKKEYIDTLKEKYYADVVFDQFKNPNNVNKWVSDKTFKLIDNLFDDINDLDYIIVNALAIDMEWVKQIQPEYEGFEVDLLHEQYINDEYPDYPGYGIAVSALTWADYSELDFEGYDEKAKSVRIAAIANKYDAVNVLGKESIKKTVLKAYEEYKKERQEEAKKYGFKYEDEITDFDKYIEEYIKELDSNYKVLGSSTDFLFYDDNDVKVFAKDLKEYDGVTLQYVGIMPKEEKLVDFVKKNDASEINSYISKLKDISLDSFEDGYLTIIDGYIPMFKMDYELDFINDLNKLGINNVFDASKADLSKIASDSYIAKASHKANIEFSNDGIKAAAVTSFGGAGAAGGGFDYRYDIPTRIIDLTFDKPFMYLVRDKKTGEVWFTGTVYEPIKFERGNYSY